MVDESKGAEGSLKRAIGVPASRMLGWVAAWTIALVLLASGAALLWPQPSTIATRGLRFRTDTIQQLKHVERHDGVLARPKPLNPGESITIRYDSVTVSYQGPPTYPKQRLRYRAQMPGDRQVVDVEVVGVNAGFSENGDTEVLNDPAPVTDFSYDINSAGDIVGMHVPEDTEGRGSRMAINSAIFEPTAILPAYEIRPGDSWTRTSSGGVTGMNDLWFNFTTRLNFEGYVSWYGVQLAHVSGRLEGDCGGWFYPEDRALPKGPGWRALKRHLEGEVHYFFDPATHRLVGGVHMDTPIVEERVPVASPTVARFNQDQIFAVETVTRTSFTVE